MYYYYSHSPKCTQHALSVSSSDMYTASATSQCSNQQPTPWALFYLPNYVYPSGAVSTILLTEMALHPLAFALQKKPYYQP